MQLTRGVLLNDVLVAFATTEAPAQLGGQLGAVRIDDWKYQFIDQSEGWFGPKVALDWPRVYNLRLDPHRALASSCIPLRVAGIYCANICENAQPDWRFRSGSALDSAAGKWHLVFNLGEFASLGLGETGILKETIDRSGPAAVPLSRTERAAHFPKPNFVTGF